jgi:peptidoglycan/LPS O-acetylase OafA/YrhL
LSNGPFPVSKSKAYFPQLDAIRGISFIAIFGFHTLAVPQSLSFPGSFVHYLFKNLDLGIEVFFVLSAFLLTWLALNEYEKKADFSLGHYFKRRTLRIWPLYFFILIMAFLVLPPWARYFHFDMSLPNPWYYILFIANFYRPDHIFFLRFLWTISVEEQFYFLWGLCLRYLHKNLFRVASVLVLTGISFSLFALYYHIPSYFNSLTYLFDFGCGCLSALLVFRGSALAVRLKKLTRPGTLAFYSYPVFHFILFYFLDHTTTGLANDLATLTSRYLIILYVALFIPEQMVNDSRTRFFEKNTFLKFTGKISYGLYCYHGITITFIHLLLSRFHLNTGIMVLTYFAVNYGIATMSFFYLETPFLKLKTKLRRV